MTRTVLVAAAHSDDEALGCGGTLARHVAEGDQVHAVFLADGVGSRDGGASEELRQREAAAAQATRALGLASVSYLGLPDNRMDSVALLDIVQPLEAVIRRLAPAIIYTHHRGDLNIDHRLTHQAVLTACRPQPGATVREIYAFEVLSSTEWVTPGPDMFRPNHYVDISGHLADKMAAIDAYALEMRDIPHSRSRAHVEILARHRGYSVGFDAAEAFEVIRCIR